MKRHIVTFAMHAKHSDVKISRFLEVASALVHKVREELKAPSVEYVGCSEVQKKKKKKQKNFTSFEQCHDTPGAEHYRCKSRNAHVGHCQRYPGSLRHNLKCHAWSTSHKIMWKGHMLTHAHTQGQKLLRLKRLNKVRQPGIHWFYFQTKRFDHNQMMNRRNGRSLCADPSYIRVLCAPSLQHLRLFYGCWVVKGMSCHYSSFNRGLR